jgi:hypothetical protein
MSNFFLTNYDEDSTNRLNIDELYEKKKQRDLNQVKLFDKVLNKVHKKIKLEANKDLQFCLFVVPEIILNTTKFDNAACIAYLMSKLKENGFAVRYTHPNLLIISWAHYIPSYVRTEYKKKTGININEFGLIDENKNDDTIHSEETNKYTSMNDNLFIKPNDVNKDKKKEYKPIDMYKPSGNLVYDNDLFDSIANKLNNR